MTQAEKEFRYGLIKATQLIEVENDLESCRIRISNCCFQPKKGSIELMKSTQNLNLEKL